MIGVIGAVIGILCLIAFEPLVRRQGWQRWTAALLAFPVAMILVLLFVRFIWH